MLPVSYIEMLGNQKISLPHSSARLPFGTAAQIQFTKQITVAINWCICLHLPFHKRTALSKTSLKVCLRIMPPSPSKFNILTVQKKNWKPKKSTYLLDHMASLFYIYCHMLAQDRGNFHASHRSTQLIKSFHKGSDRQLMGGACMTHTYRGDN